jgi:hypothetical protein
LKTINKCESISDFLPKIKKDKINRNILNMEMINQSDYFLQITEKPRNKRIFFTFI